MTDVIMFEDIYGNAVAVERGEAFKKLVEEDPKLMIFGMDLQSIAAMRREYLRRAGPLSITPESVVETFSKETVDDKEAY